MQRDSFPCVLEPLSFLGCRLVLTREVETILLILSYILREHSQISGTVEEGNQPSTHFRSTEEMLL